MSLRGRPVISDTARRKTLPPGEGREQLLRTLEPFFLYYFCTSFYFYLFMEHLYLFAVALPLFILIFMYFS